MFENDKFITVFDMVLKTTPEDFKDWLRREIILDPIKGIENLTFPPVHISREGYPERRLIMAHKIGAHAPRASYLSPPENLTGDFVIDAMIIGQWEEGDPCGGLFEGIHIEARRLEKDKTIQAVGRCLPQFLPGMQWLVKQIRKNYLSDGIDKPKVEQPDRKEKIETVCREWVNRGYTPDFNKRVFLVEIREKYDLFMTLPEFNRALRDAASRGIIRKGENGRFAPL